MKKFFSKCIICKIVQRKMLLPPSTAKLPEYRLFFQYSLENVELDYADPLFARDIFGKNRETSKSYIFIFKCTATRNTHLKLVLSESSDMFVTCNS